MDDLHAAQRAKLRRAARVRERGPGEEAGELNIVPFLDIIMNVLMFVLASLTIVFTVALALNPPKKPTLVGGPQPEGASLTVFVTNDGFTLKGRGGTIGSGCQGLGPGPTIPRVAAAANESFDGRKYDVAGLRRCVRRLKTELPDEHQIILTANPDIPFQEIVRVLDAVRRDDEGELFPDALFAVVR